MTHANHYNVDRGSLICDENGNRLLVLKKDDNKNVVECMDNTFSKVSIHYRFLHFRYYIYELDKIDMDKFCEWISEGAHNDR
jgi:hypothetical protein